ncbi:hypothetical protein BSN82_17410, partial [Acinetobacter baylyi]
QGSVPGAELTDVCRQGERLRLFGLMGRPKMGLSSVGPRRFLSLRGLSQAPKCTVGAGAGGGGIVTGLAIPKMEAQRDRAPEAEGWEAGEISSPSLGAALAPWDGVK